jgi:glycosyltransferase involved in cell wall biosynthesis
VTLLDSSPALVRNTFAELIEGRHEGGTVDHVTFMVSTSDLDSGRGDLYVALGLARALLSHGYGISIVPRERWYAQTRRDDIVIAMLPEFDSRAIPSERRTIAWIRNETVKWISSGRLPLYDQVLVTSELSRLAVQLHTSLPAAVLPIAVDAALFGTDSLRSRKSISTTANHWGTERDVHTALRLAPANAPIDWYGVSRSKDGLINRWNRGTLSYFELPAVYQRSSIVIDDLNHTTKPFGNHNSRLFEALAAGALPIVNTALGLEELGLEELPVYRTAEELASYIATAASRSAEIAELAARLRALVLEKHTFDQRAKTFIELTRDLTPRLSTHKGTLGFFPDYRETNAYQSMLYGRAEENAWTVVPVKDPVESVVIRDGGGDLSGYTFHLQWANPIIQSERDPVAALARLNKFKANVSDLHRRGGRLLWTVHNVMPHELHYYSLELALYRFLCEEADLIHVLGENSFEATKDYYVLPPEKTVVVPHASYQGVYPDFVGRAVARARMGVVDGEIVLLSMGGIRPYKGLDSLLRVFGQLSARDPRLRLLISGNPGRTMNVAALKAQLAADSRIKAKLEFVSDADLQLWLRAADIAVLPYRAVLNSSSFHLAATFGLPIIVPRLGQIAAEGGQSFVTTYQPDSDDDLAQAIRQTIAELASPEASQAAVEGWSQYGPDEMSDAFFAALT